MKFTRVTNYSLKYLHRVFYVPQILGVHSSDRFGVPTSFLSESSLLNYTLNVMEITIQEVPATESYGSSYETNSAWPGDLEGQQACLSLPMAFTKDCVVSSRQSLLHGLLSQSYM